MARTDLELELLGLRFEHYTPGVRQCISRIMSSERCEHTSDAVIDGLCTTCPDEISAVLAISGVDQHKSEGPSQAAPTPEARVVIRKFIDEARSYRAKLGDLEDDDLEALYRSTFNPIVTSKRERQAEAARDRDRWAFFSMPEADADFARWRERLLTPAQAVALSFGKEPGVVTPERLEPYRRVARSPFREAFKDRLDLIEAAAAARELSVPMSASAFAEWATARGLVPPPEMTGEPPGEDAAFWKAKYEAAQGELDRLRRGLEDIPPKTKVSIYRLLVGMAAARFEYRTDQRTKATAAIKDGLESVELSMSEDAILSNLKQAALAIDFSWTTPIHWSGVKRRGS